MVDQEKYLPVAAMRRRYDVSTRSIYRWLEDEVMRFPKPITIKNRLYFKEADLMAWEDSLRFGFPGATDKAPGN
ncbi:helix-turn-helix domain-containing protein [Phyllobacterium sp. LjRoot231]|uniref:helix-turn-helix transcriptional regulator n=1 Tax=Phyllobacterium sp. LjRoot231 TaxID=3342289 RepID=UPI003ECF9DFE